MSARQTLSPVPALEGVVPYKLVRHPAPVDLLLDGNEGLAPKAELLQRVVDAGPEIARRYPSAASLESIVAARFGVHPSQVLVRVRVGACLLLTRITARAYDALQLAPGRPAWVQVKSVALVQ